VLNLKYNSVTSSIPEDVIARDAFNVYPNPTTGLLSVSDLGAGVTDIQVLDLLGKVVLTPTVGAARIDLSTLRDGMYVLNVTTENGWFTKRVIKR